MFGRLGVVFGRMGIIARKAAGGVVVFSPSLNFTDARNSMYLGMI